MHNNTDTNVQERFQTFGDLAAVAAAAAGDTSVHHYLLSQSCVYWIVIAGPPPTKKGRLHTDESALLTVDPSLSQMLSTADSASLAGPSVVSTHVPKTEAATGLDAKLGTYLI